MVETVSSSDGLVKSQLPNLLYLLAILVFLALQLPLADYIVDDAFIHLTFARNIAEGKGFAFNPGVPTYGVTAPLWTLLLALFSIPFVPSQFMVKLLSVAFGVLTIPAFRSLAKTIGITDRSAVIAAIIWAVNVWLVRWSASGMEAPLALLLLILAFEAQIRKRFVAGIWLGLAILCRPEAAVIGVIFSLDRWRTDGIKDALRLIGIIAAVVLPWQIYALTVFGTVIPNPAQVKAGFGLPALSDFLLGLKRTSLIVGGAHGIEILLLLVIALSGTRRRLSFSDHDVRISALLIVWMVFPAIVYLAQGVFITSRYLLIGLPPIILLLFLLLDGLEERGRFLLWRRGKYILCTLLIILQLFLTWRVTLPHVTAFKPTIEALTRIAETLRDETLSGSTVAVGDVGVLGFYSGRYIVDLEGLVTHEMIPYRVGKPLDELILSGMYLKVRQIDYLVDKSQEPTRLLGISKGRYSIMMIEKVPGGLVETAAEKWYYTLYQLNGTKETSMCE